MSAVVYVERRGKPSTWLTRRKLADERIPSATITIGNFLFDKINNFRKKKNSKTFNLIFANSPQLFTYLENFYRPENFKKHR